MKRIIFALVIICLLIQCNSSIDCGPFPISKIRNESLISFNVNQEEMETLSKFISSNDRELIDEVLDLKTCQSKDTLIVEFMIYEGNYVCHDTDINIKDDTITLQRWKDIPIRELVLFKYSYKIWNKDKKSYQIKIGSID